VSPVETVTAFADRALVLRWPVPPALEAQQPREEVRAQPLQEVEQQDVPLGPAVVCSLLPGAAPASEAQQRREEVRAQPLQEVEQQDARLAPAVVWSSGRAEQRAVAKHSELVNGRSSLVIDRGVRSHLSPVGSAARGLEFSRVREPPALSGHRASR